MKSLIKKIYNLNSQSTDTSSTSKLEKQYAKAELFLEAQKYDEALEIITDLIQKKPTGSYYALQAEAYFQLKSWRLAYEAYQAATAKEYASKHLYLNYGHTCAKLNRADESVEQFRMYQTLYGELDLEHLCEFAAQVRIAEGFESSVEVLEAAKTSELYENIAAITGPWDFFLQVEDWNSAIVYLEHELKVHGEDAELIYKLGKCYHSIFDYSKAIELVKKSNQLKEKNRNYGTLAALYEDIEDFDTALEMYDKFNYQNSKIKKSHIYREAYINYRVGRYEAACQLFNEYGKYDYALSPAININYSYVTAKKLIAEGKDEEAIEMYHKAIYECNEHTAKLYHELGQIYAKLGRFEEACEVYKHQRILKLRIGHSSKAFVTKRKKNLANYAEMYDHFKLDDSIILYSSLNGVNFSGNPRAIFNQMSQRPGYKHFIVLGNQVEIPDTLINRDDVYVVRLNSYLHMTLLASAKHIITDTSLPGFYIPKKDQKLLQTWHGTPMKRLSMDTPNAGYFYARNIAKVFRHATHIINQNQFTEDMVIKSHALDKYDGTKYALTGYPRQDSLVNTSQERIDEIKAYLDIPQDKKVILYAPTFRGQGSEVDTRADARMLKAVNRMKKIENVHVLYKPHHYATGGDSRLNSFDTNELLAIVDILISDYSSIAIDFLVADKPIINFIFDEKKYNKERGLYFDIADISDYIVRNQPSLVEQVESLVLNPIVGPKQQAAREKFCPFDDGQATDRVIDFFFEDNAVAETDNRKSILLFTGNLSLVNGIIRSFENLVNNISSPDYKLTIAVTDTSVQDNESNDVLNRFYEAGHALVIVTRGEIDTAKEAYARSLFTKARHFYSEPQRDLYNSGIKRNTIRNFGFKKYDAVINYGSGYTVKMNEKLTEVETDRRVIVLHNDMQGEETMKMPYLRRSFNFFDKYDEILTVSSSVGKLNEDYLSQEFGIDRSKFGVLNNIIEYKHILEMAEKPLEVSADNKYFEESDKVFINIGRLSPEKNHIFAIDSFAQIVKKKKYRNAKFLIMGSGPSEEEIRRHIKKLNLEENVILLGIRSNPYNYLKQADCFLFPSLHEGQPLVLFEALLCETRIIASDIEPNVEFVDKYGGGVYTPLDQEAYTAAIFDYLADAKVEPTTFDCEKYNQGIVNQVYEIVNKK